METIRQEVHLAQNSQNKLQSNANKTASNSTAIWNLLLGVFFQIQTTFKLAFNRPKSLQVTEVRCPKKIHSGANSTFIFKLLKDFVSIRKARQESKVFALQCPLDIATSDIAAALPIATSNPVTDLRHYINNNFVYNDLIFRPLCSKQRPVSVAISSVRSLQPIFCL